MVEKKISDKRRISGVTGSLACVHLNIIAFKVKRVEDKKGKDAWMEQGCETVWCRRLGDNNEERRQGWKRRRGGTRTNAGIWGGGA